MENEKFDFEAFAKQAAEQLRQKKPLTGKDGIFTPLIKKILEASLEGELDAHLEETRKSEKNRRNGRTPKIINSSLGGFEIFAPRDRNSTFEPVIVEKRQHSISSDIDKQILSLYGMGVSYSDIQKHVGEMYGIEISDGTLTAITNRLIPEIKEWQNRPLENIYPVIWLDAMFFKVREDGSVKSKAIYSILGVTLEGHKEVIGIYFGHVESSSFWRQVLNDLQLRGIKDIGIACIDNLKGFADAIEDIYPKAEVQLCLVHQMRNSMKYMNWKDLKPMSSDLKKIYKANNEEMGLHYLSEAEAKWGSKYQTVFKSWRANWDRLSTFYRYPETLRKIIYTTNPIESFHRMVRKVTKTKGAYSSEDAIVKQIYLATMNANFKWSGQMRGWQLVKNDLYIYFVERLITKYYVLTTMYLLLCTILANTLTISEAHQRTCSLEDSSTPARSQKEQAYQYLQISLPEHQGIQNSFL
jgi:putative transposase